MSDADIARRALALLDLTDLADDARLVVVADHNHGSVERRLDADTVKEHEPRRGAFEDGTFNPTLAFARMQLH